MTQIQSTGSVLSNSALQQEPIDALIICDSHGNSLNEEKLYKFRKVKVIVLGKGEKTLKGAEKFLDNTTLQYKNLVIMTGSNDLSQGASPDNIIEDMQALIELVRYKSPNSKIHVFPVFHRLDSPNFNSKVDATNNNLYKLQSDYVQIVKNDTIYSSHRNLYASDGIHMSVSGNMELVRLIKTHLNPILGLRSYSKFTYSNHMSNERHRQSHNQTQPAYGPRMQQSFQPPSFENVYRTPTKLTNANIMSSPMDMRSNNSNWYSDRELIMRLLGI